jgi:hypothetical protein
MEASTQCFREDLDIQPPTNKSCHEVKTGSNNLSNSATGKSESRLSTIRPGNGGRSDAARVLQSLRKKHDIMVGIPFCPNTGTIYIRNIYR